MAVLEVNGGVVYNYIVMYLSEQQRKPTDK